MFVAIQSAAFGGVFVAVALASDLADGAAGRLALATPRRGSILTGYLLAAVLRAGWTTLALFCLAVPVGMHVGASALQLAAFLALVDEGRAGGGAARRHGGGAALQQDWTQLDGE